MSEIQNDEFIAEVDDFLVELSDWLQKVTGAEPLKEVQALLPEKNDTQARTATTEESAHRGLEGGSHLFSPSKSLISTKLSRPSVITADMPENELRPHPNITAYYNEIAIPMPIVIDEDRPLSEEQIEEKINLFGLFLNNQLDSHLGGWASNISHSAVREGATVLAAYEFRELVALAMSKSLQSASEATKLAISSALVAAVGLATVSTVIYQEKAQTATWRTRGSYASFIVGMGAAAAASVATGTFGTLAPALGKAAAAPFLRDLVGLVFTLNDNRKHGIEGNMSAVIANAATYAFNQAIVNFVSGYGYSGASDAAAHADIADALKNITIFLSAIYAGEVVDAISYPAWTAFFDQKGSQSQDIREPGSEPGRQGFQGVASLRIASRPKMPTKDAFLAKLQGPLLSRANWLMINYLMVAALGMLVAKVVRSESENNWIDNLITGVVAGLTQIPFNLANDRKPRIYGTDTEMGPLEANLASSVRESVAQMSPSVDPGNLQNIAVLQPSRSMQDLADTTPSFEQSGSRFSHDSEANRSRDERRASRDSRSSRRRPPSNPIEHT